MRPAPPGPAWSLRRSFARGSSRAARDRREVGEPSRALLARARAAALATALGYGVSVAARRRRDARLLPHLPGVHRELGVPRPPCPRDAGGPAREERGFELATPVGLVVAGVFAAASAVELRPSGLEWVMRHARSCSAALVALMAAWAFVSLAERPPLDDALAAEQLDGWQLVLAAIGVALYGLAAVGFVRLYRRRGARFVFAFMLAFALLAEAMVVIAWARNWQLSLVGVAHADARRVPRHRARGAGGVARGALQRPLPRRDARRRQGGQHRPRRPRRGSRASRSGTTRPRSPRC